MSSVNEEKQVEMELTTFEDQSTQETTLRNRFAGSNQEVESINDESGEETNKTQESSPKEVESDQSVDTDSERDPVDTPSESENEDKEEQLQVLEDFYGREYITYHGIQYYREETSWNTPFAVQLSFSLIMVINLLNIALVIGQMASC